MSFRAGWCLLWVVSLTLLVSGVSVAAAPTAALASSDGTFVSPPSVPAGFDSIRRPPIPVSFLSHEASWVTFLYPPSARDQLTPVFAQADEWRAELAAVLGRPPLMGLEVRIARGVEEMAVLAPPELPPALGVAAIAYPSIRLIVLSSAPSSGYGRVELLLCFQQQLARVSVYEATNGRELPDWVANGLATHLSGERRWGHEWLLFRAGVRGSWVPLFDGSVLAAESSRRNTADLELAAAEGEDFINDLLGAKGRSRFPTTVEAVRSGRGLVSGVREGYGTDAVALEAAWRRQLARRMTVAAIALVLAVPVLGFGSLFVIRYLRERQARKRMAEALRRQRQHIPEVPTHAHAHVHVIPGPHEESAISSSDIPSDVPKVEHEGEWHTLH